MKVDVSISNIFEIETIDLQAMGLYEWTLRLQDCWRFVQFVKRAPVRVGSVWWRISHGVVGAIQILLLNQRFILPIDINTSGVLFARFEIPSSSK